MPDHSKLPMIVVNMQRETPLLGIAQVVAKLKGVDKDKVDQAALALGLTQGEFIRTVLVSASEYALQQLGVTLTETGRYVELAKEGE